MRIPTLTEIEERLYRAMGDEKAPREGNVGGWTRYIGRSLRKIFDGATVCGKGCPVGEYLADFTGFEYKEADPWKKYKGLILAAECEWSSGNPDGLWEDFVKLVDIRADRKVFIGNLHRRYFSDQAIRSLVKKWAMHLKNHRHTSSKEKVLVMLSEKCDHPREGSWIISGDGRYSLVRPLHKRGL